MCCCAGNADQARLRELCDELLGPGTASDDSAAAAGRDGQLILGIDRRKLLKDTVLKEMGRCRPTQPLAMEFKERLDMAAAGNRQLALTDA